MTKHVKPTSIGELGEFGLIGHLTAGYMPLHDSTLKGIGDDAALLDYSGNQLVITTDMLTEGVHFNLIYTPMKHLGYKAATVNFSDVFAMNALPRQILVSIAISSKITLSMMEEFYEGIKLACTKYGVDLIGGDTTSSATGMTVSVTAIGEVAPGDAVFRNGAAQNDLICVSGNLGAAYMGLQLLEREMKLFGSTGEQPDLAGYEYLLERQLKPEARGDIIQFLREQEMKPTALIDISDGLSSELYHICGQSGTGCRIYAEKIPIDQETVKLCGEMNIEELTAALNGGEDYELLFTIPLSEFDKLKAKPEISVIGHMVPADEGLNLVTSDGQQVALIAQGWNSFRG